MPRISGIFAGLRVLRWLCERPAILLILVVTFGVVSQGQEASGQDAAPASPLAPPVRFAQGEAAASPGTLPPVNLSEILDNVGGPDSAPEGPPAPQGPPKGFGPPPPPKFAVDSWWIGPSLVEGSQARMSMSFLSVGGGKRFTFGRTFLSVRTAVSDLIYWWTTLSGPATAGTGLRPDD